MGSKMKTARQVGPGLVLAMLLSQAPAAAQEGPSLPPGGSLEFTACVAKYAPQVERAVPDLASGVEFLLTLCAVELARITDARQEAAWAQSVAEASANCLREAEKWSKLAPVTLPGMGSNAIQPDDPETYCNTQGSEAFWFLDPNSPAPPEARALAARSLLEARLKAR